MQVRLLGLLLGLFTFVSALSSAGSKLLVILEEETDKAKYSVFWKDLTDRGFQITYRSPKDASLNLFLHGEPAYSHLLLLPPKSKGLGPQLTPNLLVDFVNQGSNILLALSSEHAVPSAINSLLLELDISLPADRNTVVVDHFNYDTKSSSEKHDVLLLPGSQKGKSAVKDYFSVDGMIAMPHAVGQVLGNTSPLLASVVKAPNTAYIYNPKEETESLEDLFATGSQINLVSAFQARNSARFTVLGSSELLQDAWFDRSVESKVGKGKTANRAFAKKLSGWTFKESGVLRASQVSHKQSDPSQKAEISEGMYRIKTPVEYSIEIGEWAEDHWAPYQPPSGDHVQLEFSMLSPFHRRNLEVVASENQNSTTFTTSFTLPDQHGIFNFLVEYRRPFLTSIEEKHQVTVRHFAHDEWPRSFVISGAYPWIGGIWVTVIGWVAFVGLWLYSKPAQPMRDMKAR